MSQDKNKDTKQQVQDSEKAGFLNRREILKGLATVPVLGVFATKLLKILRMGLVRRI